MNAMEREKLSSLLQQGTVAADRLSQDLLDEQNALVGHDVDLLPGYLARKQESLAALNAFEGQMWLLLDQSGMTVDHQRSWLEQVKALQPGDRGLQDAVLRLGDLIGMCYKLTVENEGLVNIGLARVSRALEMLNGEGQGANVYNRSLEQGSPSLAGRSLAKA